jgi:NADPH:quinone reductase-like Zn-dependent oxidoreductase
VDRIGRVVSSVEDVERTCPQPAGDKLKLRARPVLPLGGGPWVRLLAVRLGVQHLDPLVELIRAEKITTVIDRRFALSEVPGALRYLGEGHAKGKVVVTVG